MMNKPKNNTGLKRIINACRYSRQGFVSTFKTEAAFRQECMLGVILFPLSFLIADTVIEWVLLLVTFLLVLLTEIINSAIEATVDRFGSEHHELSGKAKDAASAAVAVALICATISWLAIAFM